MKHILLGLLVMASALTRAQQNLVPNPSFEDTIECPAGAFTIMACKDWFSVYPANGDQWNNTISVPDYFHACSSNSGFNNYRGFQYPRTGKAYSDILAYEQPHPNERIYLEAKLNQPLKKGQVYKVTFYACLGNKYQYYTKAIGAYLSVEKQERSDYFALEVIPQIMAAQKIGDTLNWMEISGNYKAEGGEQYITIGNFFNDVNSDFSEHDESLAEQSEYFIDDVSVIACDTCEKIIPNDIFIPDAFSPNGDGKNDALFVRGANIQELYFAVYDRWGEKVWETTDKNIGWDGTRKGNYLNSAVFVYYCSGKYTDGTEFKQSGDITLIR